VILKRKTKFKSNTLLCGTARNNIHTHTQDKTKKKQKKFTQDKINHFHLTQIF